MSLCAKCNEEVTDGVLCCQCSGYLHFHCSGLSETTYLRMTSEKKENWRCVGCRSTSSSNVPNLAEVLKELKEFRKEFGEMKSDIIRMNVSIQDLASHWNDVNTRIEVMEERLDSLEVLTSQISSLQENVNITSRNIDELRNENIQLKKDNDIRDQYDRMNNLEISGVPLHSGENLDNLLAEIYMKVGLKLDTSDMNYIHRVHRFKQKNTSERPPAIVVHYTKQRSKDQLSAAVRARRGITTAHIGLMGAATNIYISDHLTPSKKLLLKRAREIKE